MQRELETRIGRSLIAGDVVDGTTLRVELNNDELEIKPR
jgi:ATP-dependent Clp protease ATP-binding subunit ClpB